MRALAGALIERIGEAGRFELAGLANPIGDRGRRLRQRQRHCPSRVRAHEIGDRGVSADLQRVGDPGVRRQGGGLLAHWRRSGLRHHGRTGGRSLRRGVGKHDIADDLIVIGRGLFVADGGGERLDLDLRRLGDLDEREAGLRQFAKKRAREHRVLFVVAVRQTIKRLLFGARRHQDEYAFGRVDARESPVRAPALPGEAKGLSRQASRMRIVRRAPLSRTPSITPSTENAASRTIPI